MKNGFTGQLETGPVKVSFICDNEAQAVSLIQAMRSLGKSSWIGWTPYDLVKSIAAIDGMDDDSAFVEATDYMDRQEAVEAANDLAEDPIHLAELLDLVEDYYEGDS